MKMLTVDTSFWKISLLFIFNLDLFAPCPFIKQGVNLIRRVEHRSDGDVMVHGINDQRKEFTHIRLNKIRFLIKFRGQIGKVCCHNFINVTLFVILVEFVESVRE